MRKLNYGKQLKDIIIFVILVWGVILLGLFIIDVLIVPLPVYFPQFHILVVSILQIGITGILILFFLFIWDRLLAYYYKVNWEKRQEKD